MLVSKKVIRRKIYIKDYLSYTALEFLKNYISGQTYFDVYADRFIGKGMQNFSLLSFNIKFEEINNISIEKAFWIHIHTSGGTYKIMTDKNTATKVFNYYIDLKS